jgi:hypothetical protein
MTVTLSERQVISALTRHRATLPSNCKLVSCVVDRASGEVIFTIGSDSFAPTAKGQPIPELAPRFASPRCQAHAVTSR